MRNHGESRRPRSDSNAHTSFAPRKCWPINSGARLRDYHLAFQLARHTEVTYLGLCYPEEEQFASDDVEPGRTRTRLQKVVTMPKARPYGAVNLLRGLLGPTPVTVLNWTNPEAAAELAELGRTARFDAIHLVGVHLLRYIPVLRNFPGNPPILCDWHDIQSEKMSALQPDHRQPPSPPLFEPYGTAAGAGRTRTAARLSGSHGRQRPRPPSHSRPSSPPLPST